MTALKQKIYDNEVKAFGERVAKKFGLKENSDEIQSAIDYIHGSLSSMSDEDKKKTDKEWREERLRERYADVAVDVITHREPFYKNAEKFIDNF